MFAMLGVDPRGAFRANNRTYTLRTGVLNSPRDRCFNEESASQTFLKRYDGKATLPVGDRGKSLP